MAKPTYPRHGTHALVRAEPYFRNAEQAFLLLREAAARFEEDGDREGLRQLTGAIIQQVPEMTLPLARELLRVDPSCGHCLTPPLPGSSERARYLTPGDARILLVKVAEQLAGLEPAGSQSLDDWTQDLRGLATAIWENERVAGEMPLDALRPLVQVARRTVVEGDFCAAKVLWACFTSLTVKAARHLTDETILHVYRAGRTDLATTEYFSAFTALLTSRPDLWQAGDIRADLAEHAGTEALAHVLALASNEVFDNLLHRLLRVEPAMAAAAVVEAEQQERAGEVTKAEDWLGAVQAADPDTRGQALSILGHIRSEAPNAG